MSTFQLYLGAKRIDVTSGSTATTMVSPANGNTNQANTLLNEALDNSETAIDVDSGSVFAVNDTIRVDDEHMKITAISTNTLTVERGHFSSTKATHSDNAPVYATNMATGLVYVVYYELGDTVFKTIRKANFLGVQTSKTTVIAECYSQSDGAKFILNERIEPKEYATNNPVTSDMIQRGALNATTIVAETRTDEVKTTQLAEALDNSETAIDVDSAVNFQAGDIILIDSEQMLVTATAPTASPNTLTVVRAHNGTSAVTHNDDTAIFEVHKGEFKTGNIYRQGVAGTNAQLSGAGILIDSKGIYGADGSGTGNLQFDISATDGKIRAGGGNVVLSEDGIILGGVGGGGSGTDGIDEAALVFQNSSYISYISAGSGASDTRYDARYHYFYNFGTTGSPVPGEIRGIDVLQLAGTSTNYIAAYGDFVIQTVDAGEDIILKTDETTRVTISDSSVSFARDVAPAADNTYDLGTSSLAWKDVFYEGSITDTSDRRKKINIIDFSNSEALEFISRLTPRTFNKLDNDDNAIDILRYGLIAQEVEDVLTGLNIDKTKSGLIQLPDTETDTLVNESGNTETVIKPRRLNYIEFITPLIGAIKELKARIETLETL